MNTCAGWVAAADGDDDCAAPDQPAHRGPRSGGGDEGVQAKEARGVLQEQTEGRQGAARAGGLALLLQGAPAGNADYQVRSNRKFFHVEPMAADIEELNEENRRLRDEISEFKGITESGKELYFHRDGFTRIVDLAITEAVTILHVSHNQVPALSLASRGRPTAAKCLKVVHGKMTHVEQEVF
eukprot:2888249-Pleurochrysis_carterae.AAC.13